jgi:hypothetical protein
VYDVRCEMDVVVVGLGRLVVVKLLVVGIFRCASLFHLGCRVNMEFVRVSPFQSTESKDSYRRLEFSAKKSSRLLVTSQRLKDHMPLMHAYKATIDLQEDQARGILVEKAAKRNHGGYKYYYIGT